jgi:hypothetical protein
MVDCYEEDCTRQANWRGCYEECVITRMPAGVIGDDDDAFFTTYYCFGCMAARWGCAEGDALVRIRDGRRDVKRRREQNAAFNAAAPAVAAAVPGVTKGERRELTVDFMKEVMSPLVRFYPYQDEDARAALPVARGALGADCEDARFPAAP